MRVSKIPQAAPEHAHTPCICRDEDIGRIIVPSCPQHGCFSRYVAQPGTYWRDYREVGVAAKGRKGV